MKTPKTEPLYGQPGTRMRAMELAERVCILFGWTGIGADTSDRAEALHELWQQWMREYEASGGSLLPKDHPALSDQAIAELAEARRATTKRTMEAIERLIEVRT